MSNDDYKNASNSTLLNRMNNLVSQTPDSPAQTAAIAPAVAAHAPLGLTVAQITPLANSERVSWGEVVNQQFGT